MSATALAHQVPGMSFSDDVLADRRTFLGASEIAAVAGLNPYKTALDVYLEKVGRAQPFAGNQFTEWGLRLEEPIAQKYAETTGFEILKPVSSARREGWMGASPDRLIVPAGRPLDLRLDLAEAFDRGLEIKRFGEYRGDDFGVPGTDEVAPDVAAQCHWSMMVTGIRAWDVAVLLGQADFRIYHLVYNSDIAGRLYDLGFQFWHENVLADVEPAVDGSNSAHRYLHLKYAVHSAQLIDPTPELMETGRQLAAVKRDMKALEGEHDRLQHELMAAIGDNQGIRNVATWKLDRAGRPSWKAIAEALGATSQPDLIAAHTSPPSRRFRLLASED